MNRNLEGATQQMMPAVLKLANKLSHTSFACITRPRLERLVLCITAAKFLPANP